MQAIVLPTASAPAPLALDDAFADTFSFERHAPVSRGRSQMNVAATVANMPAPTVLTHHACGIGQHTAVAWAMAILGLALLRHCLGTACRVLCDGVRDGILRLALDLSVAWTVAAFGWAWFFGLASAMVWRQ